MSAWKQRRLEHPTDMDPSLRWEDETGAKLTYPNDRNGSKAAIGKSGLPV